MRRHGLRFAMITTFYPPYHFGGDADYVRQLSEFLAIRGHEVDVIHDIDAFRVLSSRKVQEPESQLRGLRVHGMKSRFPKLACLATQQSGRPIVHGPRIMRILEERKPDIIHFHNVSLIGGPGVLSMGSAMKLYTAHEHWLVCPTHVLWRNNKELCDEKRCLKCELIYRRPPQLWRRTAYLEQQAANVDLFCSPSQFSARLHSKFGFKPEMKVLPSFLPDVPAGETVPLPEEHQGRPYFLFVGRLENIKGIQDVIPAFREYPAAQLWIAGAGTHQAELKKLAAGSRNILFLGKKTQDQLRPYYAHATAVLLPSICYEVLPLVVIEAFRQGVPVVARELGPYPDIVNESGGGLMFNSRENLQSAIDKISGDVAMRNALGRSARAHYVQCWSELAGMKAYFSMLREIAARRAFGSVLEVLDRCDEFGQLV